MKLPIGMLVLTLTLIKAEEDCSRCASAMTTLFNAIKTSEGYNGLSKVMHQAICKVDSTVYSCQDQERAQKLDEALEAIALSDQEAKIACKTMESKGACTSPWNTESCPTDVKDFVLAHFKNEMIQSDLKEVFKTAYESMKNTLMDENLDEWKHDIDTMVDVGFQAVFDAFKPEDVCDFFQTVKDKYEL